MERHRRLRRLLKISVPVKQCIRGLRRNGSFEMIAIDVRILYWYL